MIHLPVPGRRYLTGAFFFIPLFTSAATLRVPQDFERIQRALFAADPGDTIEIAAGTYAENLWIDNAVILRGSSTGPTVIVAPDRQKPIVTVSGDGAVALSDLTFSHGDAPLDTSEPNPSGYAVQLNSAPVALRNIRVEKTPGIYALSSTGNVLTVENLTIAAEKPFVCISLVNTRPGTRFDRVVLPEQSWGSAITVENGSAAFRDLSINPRQSASIRVSGRSSDVQFPNLSLEMLERIEWADASPDGPVTDKAAEQPSEGGDELSDEDRAAIEAYRKEDARKSALRRPLVTDAKFSATAFLYTAEGDIACGNKTTSEISVMESAKFPKVEYKLSSGTRAATPGHISASADGSLIVVRSINSISVVSTLDGKVVFETDLPNHYLGKEKGTVAISPDNRVLVAYSADGNVVAFDLKTKKKLWTKVAPYGLRNGFFFLSADVFACVARQAIEYRSTDTGDVMG